MGAAGRTKTQTIGKRRPENTVYVVHRHGTRFLKGNQTKIEKEENEKIKNRLQRRKKKKNQKQHE